jgi:hypothetical protein
LVSAALNACQKAVKPSFAAAIAGAAGAIASAAARAAARINLAIVSPEHCASSLGRQCATVKLGFDRPLSGPRA